MTPPAKESSDPQDLKISEYRYVKVSYGALVVIAGGIFAAAVWMTTVNIKLDNQALTIDILDKRLAYMEALLERSNEQNSNRR